MQEGIINKLQVLTFIPDKFDIEIMYHLFIKEMNSPFQSLKISEIIEMSSLKFTYGTYIKRIKKLLEIDFISEGIKEGNAKCYYITQKGIAFLEYTILNKEDVYEEEDE